MLVRAEVKKLFFDRAAVMKAISATQRRAFTRAGGFARKTAMRKIRPVGKSRTIVRQGLTAAEFAKQVRAERYRLASKPGQPPKSRTGLLRRNIFFAFDPPNGVVVGPARFPGGRQMIPRVLEEGGTVRRRARGGRVTTRIQARPYMAPTMREVQPKLREFIRGAA